MIPVNIRFCPTVSGFSHLGHIYNALVCRDESIRGNGKFSLRFDDTQRFWSDRLSVPDITECKRQWLLDLEWLGISPSFVSHQSELAYEAKKQLVMRCYESGIQVPKDDYVEQYYPEVIGMEGQQFPYSAYKTAEKVIMDRMEIVTMLVRGWDLINESSLYHYFCDAFKSYHPRMVYIPRLKNNNQELSKTNGDFKVKDLKEKFSSEYVLNALREACLIDPHGDWLITNIKDNPELKDFGLNK